jgi:hypothetical protein
MFSDELLDSNIIDTNIKYADYIKKHGNVKNKKR